MWSMLQGTTHTTNEVVRRVQLRHLDRLLGELETLNLREVQELPAGLSRRLREAGVGHRPEATISEVIDLVFNAQEAFLQPHPGGAHGSRRRSAA